MESTLLFAFYQEYRNVEVTLERELTKILDSKCTWQHSIRPENGGLGRFCDFQNKWHKINRHTVTPSMYSIFGTNMSNIKVALVNGYNAAASHLRSCEAEKKHFEVVAIVRQRMEALEEVGLRAGLNIDSRLKDNAYLFVNVCKEMARALEVSDKKLYDDLKAIEISAFNCKWNRERKLWRQFKALLNEYFEKFSGICSNIITNISATFSSLTSCCRARKPKIVAHAEAEQGSSTDVRSISPVQEAGEGSGSGISAVSSAQETGQGAAQEGTLHLLSQEERLRRLGVVDPLNTEAVRKYHERGQLQSLTLTGQSDKNFQEKERSRSTSPDDGLHLD